MALFLDVDPTTGPCIVCKRRPEELEVVVSHTACECGLESCLKVICDPCRLLKGNWAWIGRSLDNDEDDGSNEEYDTIEVHIDCARRIEEARA